ncbi:MAG: hypothetical protein GY856_15530, partial [bacterium]|nr:hypothetical protein [bacterium]
MTDSGDGLPLERIAVSLRSVNASRRFVGRRFVGRWFAATDDEGRAVVHHVPPGAYDILLHSLPPDYVSPRNHPYAPAPQVTLIEDHEHLRIEVPLERGFPVGVTVEVDGLPATQGRVIFRHRHTGHTFPTVLSPRSPPEVQGLLSRGVWEITVAAPAGRLLIGLEHDREELPGHRVVLDLVRDPRSHHLTWRFTTPSDLFGAVSVRGGGKASGVSVAATLLDPGPWIDAARARGGSQYERITVGLDSQDRYEMRLPDGRWRLAPVGPWVVESTPPFVDLDLAPGSSAGVDFSVALDRPEGDGAMLTVEVQEAATLRPLANPADARVEIRTLAEGATRDVQRARRGVARFLGLARGDYEVLATHPDFLEGRTEVREYEPDPRQPHRIRIELPTGAALRFEITDPQGEPLPKVTVRVERLDDDPQIRANDPEFLKAKQRRTAETDHSGRVRMQGFYP